MILSPSTLLLSQGYLVNTATAELVVARKSFQPEAEIHVEFEVRVVCAREENLPLTFGCNNYLLWNMIVA